jgi:LuxR family quorum-sensing system transcriptional regulator SolR
MSTRLPARSDSTALLDLMRRWHSGMPESAVESVVVLGPDVLGDASSRRLLATHPLDAQAAAFALVDAGDFGEGWRPSRIPLVAWQQLEAFHPPSETDWRSRWMARGARSVVRIGFGLPAGRRFDCLVFCTQALDHRDQAAALAWPTLEIWPSLKAALVAVYCPLTPRELQCLVLAFDGLTARASAQRMECTERTVNFHLANAMGKLKADNKITAIQRACWLGAI